MADEVTIMSLGYLAARHLNAFNGAIAGAGVGAATGALQRPDDTGSRRGNVLSGALRGAAMGAGAGGVGGSLMKTHILHPGGTPGSLVANTAKRWAKNTDNFARRQVYGLTGHGDPNAINMAGTARGEREAAFLGKKRDYMMKRAPSEHHIEIAKDHDDSVKAIREAASDDQAMQDAGLTSVPGIVKALSTKERRGKALNAMGRTMTSSPLALGMTAAPIAFQAPSILKGDESAEGGPTLGHKLRRVAAESTVGAVSNALPILPALGVGLGAEAGFRRINPGRGTREADL